MSNQNSHQDVEQNSEKRPTFGRYQEIPYDRMSPQQQEGYRQLAQVEGDGSPNLPGPLKIWVNNPALAIAVAPLGKHFRPPHHSLTQREREIAVNVIAGHWRAHYSSNAHAEILQGLGVAAEVIESLQSGRSASFSDRSEQTVYEVASTLTERRWVPQSLYDRAVEQLGHDKLTDLLVLLGFYTSVSLTLNFYDVPASAPGLQR